MPSVYLIPDGTKNLQSLFPAVPWSNVKDYYVEVLDEDNNVVATTPLNVIACCDECRLHFINYLGGYDSVNFLKPAIVHEASASEYKKSVNIPLSKTDTGSERFNVTANDTYEARRYCREDEMVWLQECMDSPKAFMEWTGIEGQANDYLPIVLLNGKFDKQKNKDEWVYEFVVQFKLSNEFQTLKN
jgi:hypothetical protein